MQAALCLRTPIRSAATWTAPTEPVSRHLDRAHGAGLGPTAGGDNADWNAIHDQVPWTLLLERCACPSGWGRKEGLMSGFVEAVSQRSTHSFSKQPRMWIRLLAGLGVEGDAHLGTTVKHRSRVSRDPTQPNHRQVHLLHRELLQELEAQGFVIGPGDIGENILTRGVDLLGLPTGTVLRIGATVEVRATGLRNPCVQLNHFRKGLMAATLDRDAAGNLARKAGVMGVVVTGGEIRPGDPIEIILPPEPHRRLDPV